MANLRRSGLFAALAALDLTLAGCAGISGDRNDTPVSRGRAIAAASCAACHDIDGPGPGSDGAAPGFSDPGFRHTAALPDRLANLTREGHYSMPARPLTATQIGDLLAYIQRNGGTE